MPEVNTSYEYSDNPQFENVMLEKSPEILREFANDKTLHFWVAENPKTPPDVLVTIAKQHPDNYSISFALAVNPQTPLDILQAISTHELFAFKPYLHTALALHLSLIHI